MKRFLAFIVAFILVFSMQTVFAEQEKAETGGEALTKEEKEAVLSALYEADIFLAGQFISAGLITCVELTEYYLERIEEYNEEYNCFITICDDAVEKAALRDEQLAEGKADGSLFGIPVVIKDNMDLEGYPTTNGHDLAGSRTADGNAHVADRLLEEGAVIIGKTNMSTDAQDARASYSEAVGETKNAYNTTLASGGSSGGSAAAISLNFACAGLGTDTNSSLRIPAALNGCVSLRSSTGLIPTSGIVPLNTNRDVAGAITRTVYDQAVMMDVLTDGEYDYAKELDEGALEGAQIGILKELAYPGESSYERAEENMDEEVAGAFADAVKELEACGAEVVEVSIPDIFFLDEESKEMDSPAIMAQLYGEFSALLEEEGLDAVIFPSYLSTPLKSGVDEDGRAWDVDDQVFINNCSVLSPSAALPEISVPIGSHSSGAGIGMEIAALKGDEQLLLDLAYSYTQQYDHRTIPDGAPDLYGGKAQMYVEELMDRNVAAVSAVGSTVGAAISSDGIITGWEHIRNVLLICGISSAVVVIISHRFIFRGNRRQNKNQKRKKSGTGRT